MKVFVFLYSLSTGGTERVTANLANAWAERGWEVVLVTLAPQSQDFYVLRPDIKRIALGFTGDSGGLINALRKSFCRIGALRRALSNEKPDILLGMATSAGILSILSSLGLGFRVIVSERVHPPQFPLGRVWSGLRRMTYPFASCVVMLSRESLSWLESNIPYAKGAVIQNPVQYPLPIIVPTLKPEHFVSQERQLLLAVGRLEVQKGFDLLIESFAALAQKFPLWDLAILGEGTERISLENQIAALGLKNRVTLPGRVGNMGDWYGRASLYVMSSYFEGFPNTLVEALAYGCAAVSYDCDTGPRDIIRDEVDGLLVMPVGSIPALTNVLDRLMGNEAERDCMAARAVEVRERYSMARIQAMWDALILEKG